MIGFIYTQVAKGPYIYNWVAFKASLATGPNVTCRKGGCIHYTFNYEIK